jgi:hypothetical protein
VLFEQSDVGAKRASDRSVARLFYDLTSETSLLVRQEIALLKTELHEKAGQLGRGVGALAAGGLIAFSGWLVLLAAAIIGLSTILALWLAALLVGLVVLALGAALLFFGKSRVDPAALAPRRTLNSLRETEAWVRDRVA